MLGAQIAIRFGWLNFILTHWGGPRVDMPTFAALRFGAEKHKMERLESCLDFLVSEDIYPHYRPMQSAGTTPEVMIEGRPLLMFCSNNYLSLSNAPELKEAAVEQMAVHGMGPGGSRCLCGNVAVLNDLDRTTADLVGTEDAITFPTGYMANLSVFRGVLDPFLADGIPYKKGQATVFSDEYNHATVVDGIRLSSAKKVIFKHSDLDDLERKLRRSGGRGPRLIVTEGVFSLDGEVSPLPEIVALAERYGAILMVDDAHGVGMMGDNGGGTVEHFGLRGRVDIIMGSYDKALGGMGGFLAGRQKMVDYLRVAARAYMFSSAPSALMAGAMVRSMEMCMGQPERRQRLRANARMLMDGLRAQGFTVYGDGTVPVAPLLIGDEAKAVVFEEKAFELGVFAPAFRWPAVPKNTARIRVTPMADHTEDQINQAVSIYSQVGREMGLVQ